MAISDKLNYLQETKNAIRNAIIEKGIEVSDTDIFRSYANKIESINAIDTIDLPVIKYISDRLNGEEDKPLYNTYISYATAWELNRELDIVWENGDRCDIWKVALDEDNNEVPTLYKTITVETTCHLEDDAVYKITVIKDNGGTGKETTRYVKINTKSQINFIIIGTEVLNRKDTYRGPVTIKFEYNKETMKYLVDYSYYIENGTPIMLWQNGKPLNGLTKVTEGDKTYYTYILTTSVTKKFTIVAQGKNKDILPTEKDITVAPATN